MLRRLHSGPGSVPTKQFRKGAKLTAARADPELVIKVIRDKYTRDTRKVMPSSSC